MIWSDSEFPKIRTPYSEAEADRLVLFCLPAKNNQLSGYYDPNSVISADLTSSIPPEINTVFWEYVRVGMLSNILAC